jgi:hypothetical protein
LETFQIVAVSSNKGEGLQFVGAPEKMAAPEFIGTDQFVGQAFRTCMEEIDETQKFKEGVVHRVPTARALAEDRAILTVNQEIFLQKGEEHTPGGIGLGQGVSADPVQVLLPQPIPVFGRDLYGMARRCPGVRGLFSPPFRHIQVGFAERIGGGSEKGAWETMAVLGTIGDPFLYSTGQNGTRFPQYPFLCSQFLPTLAAQARSARGADTQVIETANVTVDSAGTGGHGQASVSAWGLASTDGIGEAVNG